MKKTKLVALSTDSVEGTLVKSLARVREGAGFLRESEWGSRQPGHARHRLRCPRNPGFAQAARQERSRSWRRSRRLESVIAEKRTHRTQVQVAGRLPSAWISPHSLSPFPSLLPQRISSHSLFSMQIIKSPHGPAPSAEGRPTNIFDFLKVSRRDACLTARRVLSLTAMPLRRNAAQPQQGRSRVCCVHKGRRWMGA